jgi:hypothetical protein
VLISVDQYWSVDPMGRAWKLALGYWSVLISVDQCWSVLISIDQLIQWVGPENWLWAIDQFWPVFLKKTIFRVCVKNKSLPSRRRIVVIAFADRTEDPGFESRQGVRFLGIYTLQWCCHTLIYIVIVCTWEIMND